MEFRVGISVSFLVGAEGTKILYGPWGNSIIECEVDPSGAWAWYEETKLTSGSK